ncbi:hypothetical protein [Butyrivibrio sp. AD3002]|uniref:hypothetical protein n=1 Tax=Butyrivibrio sp. AD3002 TaxID=1280670 RepID=UPI0003B79004|nr:hypothetical protein [Butyrivibrio sp. AD3002]
MMLGKKIGATISSTGDDYAEEKWIRNIPAFSVTEFQDKENVDVLLSVCGGVQDDVEKTLLEAGYKNPEYSNSFLPEAMDLMYPFLFEDSTACIEGLYEYGKVRLNTEGIVIDAGANIGMFSCLAASRNCKVYAFEPSAAINEVLMQNAVLYGNSINVINLSEIKNDNTLMT